MLQRYLDRSLIGRELSIDKKHEFFDIKQAAFLHNADTFYYSIKLDEDFTRESKDKHVLALRRWKEAEASGKDLIYLKENRAKIKGLEDCVICAQRYSKYYDICISKEGMFDCFIASVVPPSSDGGESVTAEIIVQLRSDFLWQHTTSECFELSYQKISCFIRYFHLTVKEVKENRIDFAWHSNYIVNPEKYFDVRGLHEKMVSRIHQGYMHWDDNADGYDMDYVALGKRSNKIFVRIYLKSKEVVEMGYKGWFLKLWQMQGMISRYDYYCYELCYQKRDWKYLNAARLEFYLEYGSDEDMKACVRKLLSAKHLNQVEIKRLANVLTPKITLIMNVEFQVMRRATKSMELLPVHDNRDKGESARIYDFLDNWQYITEYLTYDILRLCNNDSARKSRRSMTDFWTRLRGTGIYAGPEKEGHAKVVRTYQRKMNIETMKSRFVNAAIGLSMYLKGANKSSVIRDCMDGISILNDNDLKRAERKKARRMAVFDNEQLNGTRAALEEAMDGAWLDVSRWGPDDWLDLIMNGSDVVMEMEMQDDGY